jgi:beta-lactamase regulating signal transducer with metallopeptidase domain
MTTAIAVIVDASVVTAVALLVCRALRRTPAALRHLILAASLAAVAAAPLLETALPHWEFPILATTAQITSSAPTLSAELATPLAVDATDAPVRPRLTWTAALVTVWTFGVMAVMAGLLAGLGRLMATTRRCRLIPSTMWQERAEALSAQHGLRRPVAVLECPDRALLVTWGVFRPRIIVPAGADSWSAERIDVVLAHELAHIVRCDWVLQIAAEVLRALHWFNPLVWIACRRLRDESEQACDDAVLRRGLQPVDYASHLLAVARHVSAGGRAWESAPAVADPSTLERRIAAMLNTSSNRSPLTRTARACAVAATLVVAVPIAAATFTERVAAAPVTTPAVLHVVAPGAPEPAPRPAVVAARPARRPVLERGAATPAPQKPASLSGTLVDSSGAVLPGVQLTLTDAGSGMKYAAVSGPDGAFTFRDLAPSRYELVARLPGFASILNELALASGEDLQRRIEMRVGSLQETVTVSCPVGTAVLPVGAAVLAFDSRPPTTRLFAQQAVPIRVGGQIAAPRQTKRVSPLCPGNLPGNGLIVILEATIGVDGLVQDVKVVRPKPGEQQEIVQTAIDAVRQWEYTATRLNNVPVPVILTVTVTYTRQ